MNNENNNQIICQICLQDITNGNHAWNCAMNPININNGEFQLNNQNIINQKGDNLCYVKNVKINI